jgi:hypothetical protein
MRIHCDQSRYEGRSRVWSLIRIGTFQVVAWTSAYAARRSSRPALKWSKRGPLHELGLVGYMKASYHQVRCALSGLAAALGTV